MDYQHMTKEELIDYINEAEKKRAFTYDDQMKLTFLDSAPFTIWASDRDCIIKFWAGQCESLYGYKKEDVIGKDFVDLFVAPDEQKAAREDQISIIDNGEVFHNIANDVAKSGNTLRLLTNCWRYKAPDSDEYWNFEMGLIIDFYKQEEARLEKIIKESKQLKEGVNAFVDLSQRAHAQYIEKRNSLRKSIHECDQKAISLRKREAFKSRMKPIRTRLDEINGSINQLVEDSTLGVQTCAVSTEVESLTKRFNDEYDDIMFQFEELVADFQEISMDYIPVSENIAVEKETILKDASTYHASLHERAYNLKRDISDEISAYKQNVTANPNSLQLRQLEDYRNSVTALITHINADQVQVMDSIQNISKISDLILFRKSMSSKFEQHELSLDQINNSFRGNA